MKDKDPDPSDHPDHPFQEVAASADKAIKEGGTVYQKWTCDACGDRIIMDVPNSFYTRGVHEDCKVDPTQETNIREKGCNFLLIQAFLVKEN